MRSILKFTILTILSVLFLMPVSAQEKTDPGSAKDRKSDDSITVKIPPATRKPEEKQAVQATKESNFPKSKIGKRAQLRHFRTALSVTASGMNPKKAEE